MANLFGGADLFGNRIPQDFNPEWQDPTSGVVDVTGKVVGNTQLNPYDYATQGTANQVGGILGLPVQAVTATGPGASANQQYELQTTTPGHALGAGRAAQQMQYATKGRYNMDTGQYDKEDPATVMARLKADIAPPMLDSQKLPTSTISPSSAYQYPSYVGKHPMEVGGGQGYTGYNPAGARGQAPVRTNPMTMTTPTTSPTQGGIQTAGGAGGVGGQGATTNPAARRAQMAALLRARLRGGQPPTAPKVS